MKGEQYINIETRLLKYDFRINRKVSQIIDDSATGKSSFCNLIDKWNKDSSIVNIKSSLPVETLNISNFERALTYESEKIFIFDEIKTVNTDYFSQLVKRTNNYIIIISRERIRRIPISVEAIYRIETSKSKKIINKFSVKDFHIPIKIDKIDKLIVEDEKSGFQFFRKLNNNIETLKGKDNIINFINKNKNGLINTLFIVDGSAFGSYIEETYSVLKNIHNSSIILPESFEFLLIESDIFKEPALLNETEYPDKYIEIEDYMTWEKYFYNRIYKYSRDTGDRYKFYNKDKLSAWYLENKQFNKVIAKLYNKYLKMNSLNW